MVKDIIKHNGKEDQLSTINIDGCLESTPRVEEAEWFMVVDDFENGWGKREYPHCSKCHRGVYRHDAGKYCTFCGRTMKNPMV